MIDQAALARRRDQIYARLAAAGRDVELVAVTKGFGPELVELAWRVGLGAVGESYAPEMAAKRVAVDPEIEEALDWHVVGRLQTRRIRVFAERPVRLWQSVDRARVVDELAKRAPGARLLLQVSISGEEAKGGCLPAELDGLRQRAEEAGLVVEGLMGVAVNDLAEARQQFALLRRLVDDQGLSVCSMGMSGDLGPALDEGATMVRLGSALFGPRP